MTEISEATPPTADTSQPMHRVLTEIGVGGFKSFTNLTKIKLGCLSILAGTNSSGKSSIMQPLLLMKQTIEAPYDPGILLLDGSNVKFTSSEQFISTQSFSSNGSKYFQIFLAANNENFFQSNFQWSIDNGISQHSQIYTIWGKEIILRLNMEPAEIQAEIEKVGAFPPEHIDIIFSDAAIARERSFFIVKGGGGTRYLLNSQTFADVLRSMIHVPGVRGNPERIYKTAATDGNTFVGSFESYVVSVIDRFQKQEPEKLTQLKSHLQKLGLTDTIQTQRLNETQLELRVGRVPGNSNDMVNIADVGFGVSQVLPVIVALLVAQPGQLVYIEQPEIHLHPRAQVALAEIFAEAINRGVQVIVETHSELFLLSIQALVAENKIAPDDVQLHWFTRSADGSSTVTTAELDETGAFGDWPEDFGSTSLESTHRYLSAAEKKIWESANHG
jgi:predicted ATPase